MNVQTMESISTVFTYAYGIGDVALNTASVTYKDISHNAWKPKIVCVFFTFVFVTTTTTTVTSTVTAFRKINPFCHVHNVVGIFKPQFRT